MLVQRPNIGYVFKVSKDVWKTCDLGYILTEGDKISRQWYYVKSVRIRTEYGHFLRSVGITESPYIDQFPKILILENQQFNFEFLSLPGELISNDIAINFFSDELLVQNWGAIFLINGYSVAMIHNQKIYYVFDSHRRDANGNSICHGTSVLLRYETLNFVRTYLRDLYKVNFFTFCM